MRTKCLLTLFPTSSNPTMMVSHLYFPLCLCSILWLPLADWPSLFTHQSWWPKKAVLIRSSGWRDVHGTRVSLSLKSNFCDLYLSSSGWVRCPWSTVIKIVAKPYSWTKPIKGTHKIRDGLCRHSRHVYHIFLSHLNLLASRALFPLEGSEVRDKQSILVNLYIMFGFA